MTTAALLISAGILISLRVAYRLGETAGFISAMQAAEDAESRMHTIRQRTNDGSEH